MLLMLIAIAIISVVLDIGSAIQQGEFVFTKDAVAIFVVVILITPVEIPWVGLSTQTVGGKHLTIVWIEMEKLFVHWFRK